jgi:hypothetical protein
MMHMFKNLSTVKDYNHSEVDGDARNRMKRHRKLQGRQLRSVSYGRRQCAGTAERAMQVVQSAAVPGFKAVCVSVRPINGTFGNHYFTVVLFDRADDSSCRTPE